MRTFIGVCKYVTKSILFDYPSCKIKEHKFCRTTKIRKRVIVSDILKRKQKSK